MTNANQALSGHPPIELVASPWRNTFISLLRSVEEDLFVASPYIGRQAVELIREELSLSGVLMTGRLAVLANLSVENMARGGVDTGALAALVRDAVHAQVYHLPSLHAKLYVADNHSAVVTSANLTQGGLVRNTGYGIYIRTPQLVQAIRQDAESYAALGAYVALQTLDSFASAAAELTSLRDELRRSEARSLQDAFQYKLEQTHLAVLQCRALDESTHGILARTLLYVLRRGPMRTQELHPLVQSIHPDLCDDTVDRVIDGVHFGKKWKHYVRNAQQHLKRRGLAAFDGRQWSLTQQGDVVAHQAPLAH